MSKTLPPKYQSVVFLLFIGVLAASTGAIFIRLAQANGISSLVIAAFRLVLASIILVPITLIKYRPYLYQFRKKDWIYFLLAGIFLSLHFAFWISSLKYTSIANSVILVSTTPIWVVLAGVIFFHEASNKFIYYGMLIAITGSVLLGLNDLCSIQAHQVTCSRLIKVDKYSLLGDILAILGAFSAAGYLIIGRKFRSSVPLIPYITIVYSFSALFLTSMAVISGKPFVGFPSIGYLWLILLALIPQLLGHSIINWSLKHLPSSLVSIFLLGEPLGSTIFAYLLFQEEVNFIKITGISCLLMGIWFSTRNKNP